MDKQTVLMWLKENFRQIQKQFSVKKLSVCGSAASGEGGDSSDVVYRQLSRPTYGTEML